MIEIENLTDKVWCLVEQNDSCYLSTEDRILQSAIDLIEKKGYKAVTTKEIAKNAGFSEMTLFRHFGTKQKLFERAVEKYSYTIDMKNILEENVTYDLMTDLTLVSKAYHEHLNRNYKIIVITFQERNTYPHLGKKVTENPITLKKQLTNYFKEMQRRNKMIDVDPEMQTMNFLYMNLGYFLSKFVSGHHVAQVPLDKFIEESVKTFVRGIEVKDEVLV